MGQKINLILNKNDFKLSILNSNQIDVDSLIQTISLNDCLSCNFCKNNLELKIFVLDQNPSLSIKQEPKRSIEPEIELEEGEEESTSDNSDPLETIVVKEESQEQESQEQELSQDYELALESMLQTQMQVPVEPKVRKKYSSYSREHRQQIISCANKGQDWVALAEQLGVNYKTAYSWIRTGRTEMLPKGCKPKIFNDVHLKEMLSWLEDDARITLKQIKDQIFTRFGISASITTIGNYLVNQVYSIRKPYSSLNPERFLQTLKMNSEKQIIWIGETNYNLYSRNPQSKGSTVNKKILKPSKEPKVNLLAAISNNGLVLTQKSRQYYTRDQINEYLSNLLVHLRLPMNEILLALEDSFGEVEFNNVIRVPSNLNPLELIWLKVKEEVQAICSSGSIGEDRQMYLEVAIDTALDKISKEDCLKAIQECTKFEEIPSTS